MANITKLRDEVRDAQEAERILQSTQFKCIMQEIERQYLEELLATDETQDLERYRKKVAIEVVRDVSRKLGNIVKNGKLSQADLAAMEGS